MRGVPWWGVVSSALAPVLLVGGWTVAAALQPGSFDAVARTISALAAHGAADRWVMTIALVGVAGCFFLTGVALRPATLAGRLLLMAGGVAGLLIAANPEPPRGGTLAHGVWVTLGLAALTIWPVVGQRRGQAVPHGLRPVPAFAAVGVMLCLFAWFGLEVILGGGQIGLSERVLATAQAVWPLAVVVTAFAARRRTASPELRSLQRHR